MVWHSDWALNNWLNSNGKSIEIVFCAAGIVVKA